jgi:hypothetical protein
LEKEGYKIKRAQEYFAQMESNAGNLMDIDFMFVDQDTFNNFNLRHAVDIKAAREWKQKLAVNALFKIESDK